MTVLHWGAPPGIVPGITTPPQRQAVSAGASVAFAVAASGAAPLSYQWRRDGQVIAGATSATLTLSNVQPADAGSYTVIVSNTVTFIGVGAFGLTANSRDAALLMTLPPGSYTAQESGVGGTVGVAFVEVYEVP
ncbi:MAG: immunoglobulin domain-containing protein [Verrucomicrobia bacterium]|nr:immunoglobulin domain-containing protein [Verrucomicrobiota bacterium]